MILSPSFSKNFIIATLAAIVFASAVFSAWFPPSGDFWFVEASWPLGAFAFLAITFRNFRFSNASYAILSIWLVLHLIGARYTFELVPMNWLNNALGFERNHFDRIAHFAIGLNAFLFAELFWRKRLVASVPVAAFFGLIAMMALAAGWEVIEWLYAAYDGGEAGAAFLGAQGDIWDAQKDILCDTLGAIFAMPFFYFAWRGRVE